MECRIKELKGKFKPFTLEIDITNEKEFRILYHRLNISDTIVLDTQVTTVVPEIHNSDLNTNLLFDIMYAKAMKIYLKP